MATGSASGARREGEIARGRRENIEEQDYTFRVLLDRNGTVVDNSLVSRIPALILIDRDITEHKAA
jgi:hypothetical protein